MPLALGKGGIIPYGIVQPFKSFVNRFSCIAVTDYTLGIDQQKTLSNLAKRCREINGWGEHDLLQYAATANFKAEIEMKLQFLQEVVPLLEDEYKKETLKIISALPRRNTPGVRRLRTHGESGLSGHTPVPACGKTEGADG